MKIKNLLYCGLILMGLQAGVSFAQSVDPVGSPITLGQWNQDFHLAKTYSEQNNIPMVMYWGSPSCSICTGFKSSVLSTTTVEDWMEEQQLVMCYVDEEPSVPYSDALNFAAFGQNNLSAFPFMAVYYRSDNVEPYNFEARYYNATTLTAHIDSYLDSIGWSSAPREGLALQGDNRIYDNATSQYSAFYYDGEGGEQNVSSQVIWSIDAPSYASISQSGVLYPVNFTGTTRDVTVSAVYTVDGVQKTAERYVEISDYDRPVGDPVSMHIAGPETVQGETTGQYEALYTYENGFSYEIDAASSVYWMIASGPASIDQEGVLTALTVSSDSTASIYVQVVTESGLFFEDTFEVNITVDVPPPPPAIVITGPESVTEAGSSQYTAVLVADGSEDLNVTDLAEWSTSGVAGSTVDGGLFNAGLVAVDSPCAISADYDGVTSTKWITVKDQTLAVVALEIRGAAAIDEKGQSAYQSFVYYSDESSENVTDSTVWSVDTGEAAIDNGGVLVVGSVDSDLSAVVSADYSGLTVAKSVALRADSTAAVSPAYSLVLEVPSVAHAGTSVQLSAYLSDGENLITNVTESAQWLMDGVQGEFVNPGLLDTVASDTDVSVTVFARYIDINGILYESEEFAITLSAEELPCVEAAVSISIDGAASVSESQTHQYRAYFQKGVQNAVEITDDVIWSLSDTSDSTISASGELSVNSLESNSTVDVVAAYSYMGDCSTTNMMATQSVQLVAELPSPTGLIIEGPGSISTDDGVVSYTAFYDYNGVKGEEVTTLVDWLSDAGAFTSAGTYDCSTISENGTYRILARYEGLQGDMSVQVTAANTCVSDRMLEIRGSADSVDEGATLQLSAWVVDNGSCNVDIDVTDQAIWNIDQSHASVSGGLIDPGSFDYTTIATVDVAYDGLVAQKSVTFVAEAIDPVGYPVSSEVVGPEVVELGDTVDYDVYEVYSNGARVKVGVNAYWTISDFTGVTIDAASGEVSVADTAASGQFDIYVEGYDLYPYYADMSVTIGGGTGTLMFSGYTAENTAIPVDTEFETAEGATSVFWVSRVGGSIGSVSADLVFNGDVVSTVNWGTGESGSKLVEFVVPVYEGYQDPAAVLLVLTSNDAEISATQGSVGFYLYDEIFDVTVAEYVSVYDDMPFNTVDNQWFYPRQSSGGTILRSVTPTGINDSVVLSADLSGPGLLVFNAGLGYGLNKSGGMGLLRVLFDNQEVLTIDGGDFLTEPAVLDLPSGAHTVYFEFVRTDETFDGDFAWIENAEFVDLKGVTAIYPESGQAIRDNAYVNLQWENSLSVLREIVGASDLGYKLYAGSTEEGMELISTICPVPDTEVVNYSLPLNGEGSVYWRVDLVLDRSASAGGDSPEEYTGEVFSFEVVNAQAPILTLDETLLSQAAWYAGMQTDPLVVGLNLIQGLDGRIGAFVLDGDQSADLGYSVLSGALPAGMSIIFEDSDMYLTGAPTTIVEGEVTIQVYAQAGSSVIDGSTITFLYNVVEMPAAITGTYNGILWNEGDVEDADEYYYSYYEAIPTTLSVNSSGNVTGTINVNGQSYAVNSDVFDGQYYYTEGLFKSTTLIDIDADTSVDMTVEISMPKDEESGDFFGTPVMYILYRMTGYDADGFYGPIISVDGELDGNSWDDNPVDVYNQGVLNEIVGQYTLAFGSDTVEPYGHCYLMLNVTSDGNVAMSGRTADGKEISDNGRVVIRDPQEYIIGGETYIAYVDFLDNSINNTEGGLFYSRIYFGISAEDGVIPLFATDTLWCNYDPKATEFYEFYGFERDPDGYGGLYIPSLAMSQYFPEASAFNVYYPEDSTEATAAATLSLSVSQSGHSIALDATTGELTIIADGKSGYGVITPYAYFKGYGEIAAWGYVTESAPDEDENRSYNYTKSTGWLLEEN